MKRMKKLLSLPPNLVGCFHEVTGLSRDEFFCTNDPVGHKLGSGGGTAWLLKEAWRDEGAQQPFDQWLASERRIVLHAGGQSRRLPAYAPSGKILTPIPVFRWERGQRLSQTLLDLQLPLFERIMAQAPSRLNTMIVSGDVYIRAAERLGTIPDADVVCYGLWLDASIAKDHGVSVSERRTPNVLKQMLQKPSIEQLTALQNDHFYLTDIGVWLLSDRAVQLLMQRSMQGDAIQEYDLYGTFGCALGTSPTLDDAELKKLSVAIVPLLGGEFYHFGTSREMISSTVAIQNRVNDQRDILHHDRKPHPSIFTQNALTEVTFTAENTNIWIENSHIGPHCKLTHDNIVTGVPLGDWHITLQPGECLDVIPIDDTQYCIRRYHIDDRFAGDEQQRKQFPVVENLETKEVIELISAEDITQRANLMRLVAQRNAFRKTNWTALARNWQHSVFYQLDLDDAAREFQSFGLPLPQPIDNDAPLMTRIHDAMFRGDSDRAFSLLREGLTEQALNAKQQPLLSVLPDQIVWGRSPVRIDIAGGWTDTPPYCLMEGGNVVNFAIELNGQPPLQAYAKPCKEPHIVLRSIDLGAVETVETWEQLADFRHIGSPFSIPKAALALAGFLPAFAQEKHLSLKAQLEDFGCGIELTLLSAVPAGSGLGTSSILAATVLGVINDFCSLAWDKNEICHRTLVLEQLLTTGGGWQDQYGGVLGGVKLLQSQRGFSQTPQVRWLPDTLYTLPDHAACQLLYYTGITRTAKSILAEIVRRMFLNHGNELHLLRDMKAHTLDMYEAIQRQDFSAMGRLVRKTWTQNQRMDSGTNPDSVRRITDLVDDLCLGYKLPGAGGGGYLYMIAKDPEAAARIRSIINAVQPNPRARFVEMTLSQQGLQVSRS